MKNYTNKADFSENFQNADAHRNFFDFHEH